MILHSWAGVLLLLGYVSEAMFLYSINSIQDTKLISIESNDISQGDEIELVKMSILCR